MNQEEIDLSSVLFEAKLLHSLNEISISLLSIISLGWEEDLGGEEDIGAASGERRIGDGGADLCLVVVVASGVNV